jgi:thiosulfate reductase/polysulfide reductase chain A
MLNKRYSRRRFMRTSITWTAGMAASHHALSKSPDPTQKSVSRTSLKSLTAIPTTCKQCPAGCGVIAYLHGNRLVQILGNPAHPHNRGNICAKGVAGINLVNDPERVLFPMKRVGSRGDGVWSRITWDEVYVSIGKRIENLIKNGQPDGWFTDIGEEDPLLVRLLDAIGSNVRINRYWLKNRNRMAAFYSMIKAPQIFEDVGRSRLILNFGANPYASHDRFFPMARQIVDARVYKGAKLITFDVRMSETAAQSDEWHPIKPGTDAMVALAIARIIVEKELVDSDFIQKKTNSSLSQLRRHLVQYTLEAVERESGVRATVIERLALEFATQKPSVAIIGGGVSDHANGMENVRCISLLNWITGNLEEEGGIFVPPLTHLHPKDNPSPSKTVEGITETIGSLSQVFDEKRKIDTYFAYMANPAYSEPDCTTLSHQLQDEKNVPFLVVMDTHMTETARLADLVIPAATYLEGWGLEIVPSMGRTITLNLRQPTVSLLSTAQALRMPEFEEGKLLENTFRPRGEAKEIGNFSIELSLRLGKGIKEQLPYKNTRDFVVKSVATVAECDLESLERNGFWMGRPSAAHERRFPGMEQSQFLLQRVSISASAEKDQPFPPMPVYVPVDTHKDLRGNEFILTMYKSNLWANGTANSKWVREISHENRLWINREAAVSLNISNGDKVRVVSSVGALDIRVILTSRIHPRSVALAEGMGHDAVGNVARGIRFKSSDFDTSLIWWAKSGNGVNPYAVIERRKDPFGGGYALKDTVVWIEKI